VQIGGRTEEIPGVIGLIRTAMNRALQGDYKFLMAVIAFVRLSGLSDVSSDALLPETDTGSDEAILADFLKRHGLSPQTSVAPNQKGQKFSSDGVHDDTN